MITRSLVLVPVLTLLLAVSGVSQHIPSGTVLPIMVGTSLNSAKAKPGDKVSGKLMQDVLLPSGGKIRAGTRIDGKILDSSNTSTTPAARLTLRFDRLVNNGKEFPISVSLRALASAQDVFSAQLPTSTFDEYGTSISDWTTVQVGGAAVYLGDGTVRDALDIVGRAPAYGVVTAKLLAAPKRGCPANPAEGEHEQSLWVFSPWACGTYGFEDLEIAHHGVTSPVGAIVLVAPKAVRVRGGSGWLLQVVESGPDAGTEPAL